MINFRLFILICVVISTNLYANDELIKEFSESLSRLSSEIEITGVGVGSTTFSMELWHDGHVDWSSTNLIEITVTE